MKQLDVSFEKDVNIAEAMADSIGMSVEELRKLIAKFHLFGHQDAVRRWTGSANSLKRLESGAGFWFTTKHRMQSKDGQPFTMKLESQLLSYDSTTCHWRTLATLSPL
jgi:hypothetical protein